MPDITYTSVQLYLPDPTIICNNKVSIPSY